MKGGWFKHFARRLQVGATVTPIINATPAMNVYAGHAQHPGRTVARRRIRRRP